MKQRINLLIAFSVVALIVLSTVQCYLVKTTYDYKVAQFHTEIKNEIAQVSNNYSDIDSVIVSKLFSGIPVIFASTSRSGIED